MQKLMVWIIGVLSLSTLYLGVQYYSMQRLQNNLSLQLFEQKQDNKWLERQLQLTQSQLKSSQARIAQIHAIPSPKHQDIELNGVIANEAGKTRLQVSAKQAEEKIKRSSSGVIY